MRYLCLFGLASGATALSISISYSLTATFTATIYETVTTCPCTVTTSSTPSVLLPSNPIQATPTTSSPGTTQATSTLLTTTSSTLASSSTIASSVTTLATSTSSTAVSSTTGIPAAATDEADYVDALLLHHNVHRANHSANAITWSDTMAVIAQTIADTCVYGHNVTVSGGGYGQNIGAGFSATPLGMGEMITEFMYNDEMPNYLYYGQEPNYTTLDQWGHFSQIVWKGSSSVGCYTSNCTANGLANTNGGVQPFFTVCNYSPAGNVEGEFADNVGEPLGQPVVDQNCGLTS
ncbi:CAP domain-containing protein [Exophiala viscosa]|uniref:CAP domain-containing protein n=1 Tax=Exophiala viscosa TaxID=2486360 RepID=UPI002193D357|nr:CAP domain-containing protein [Exophiala viscosa]